jgi:hypothetical protein
MKRVVLSTIVILALSTASFAGKFVAEGESNSALGNYRIEMDDNLITLNGKAHLPYIITYENTGMKVRVAVDMDRRCKKYYVLSDNLSVQYICARQLIGIEFLDKSLENDGFKTSVENLNRKANFQQKVIGKSSRDILENTKLIACFYPMLLKYEESVVAER